MTTELITELNETIKELTSKLPANVGSKENQKLSKSLEASMTEYFRQVEMALPTASIEAIYLKNVKAD